MKSKVGVSVAIVGIAVAAAPVVYAATTYESELTQSITAGTISTSITDASGNPVTSPSFAMSSLTASNSVQTSTGTFGSNTQRIAVDNPNGSINGGAWTLALNATDPANGRWTSGSNSYMYNGTAATGQLTVNPSVGTITAVVGGNEGVSLGSSDAFADGSPITLATATTSAAPIWNGYITGIGLSQSIPASQATGSYVLPMTQTVTAQ